MPVGDVAGRKGRDEQAGRQVAEHRGKSRATSEPTGDRRHQQDKTDFEDGGRGRLHSASRSVVLRESGSVQRIGRVGWRLGPTCVSSQLVSGLLSLIACRTRSFASTVCSQAPGFQLRLAISPLQRRRSPRG